MTIWRAVKVKVSSIHILGCQKIDLDSEIIFDRELDRGTRRRRFSGSRMEKSHNSRVLTILPDFLSRTSSVC
jgi:hypothetical protein